MSSSLETVPTSALFPRQKWEISNAKHGEFSEKYRGTKVEIVKFSKNWRTHMEIVMEATFHQDEDHENEDREAVAMVSSKGIWIHRSIGALPHPWLGTEIDWQQWLASQYSDDPGIFVNKYSLLYNIQLHQAIFYQGLTNLAASIGKQNHPLWFVDIINPIGSMCGVYANIWGI